MLIKFYKIFFFILVLILINSCDAPHDNLLDPSNPDNTIHIITGTVQTASIPFRPIEGVNITVKDENQVAQTDTEGIFQIELYDNSDVTLYYEKSDFHFDSTIIMWGGIKSISIEKHLNAKPKLDSVAFYSVVEFRYPDTRTTSLTIKTKISDAELDDVDKVFVENSFYNLSPQLSYNFDEACYALTLTAADLSTNNIEGVIGKEFNIIVQNAIEEKFIVGTTNIKRIINQQPEFISPANNIDTITVGPTLRWRRFDSGYHFTYTLEIYTNEIWPQLVWEEENITSSEIEFFVEDTLPSGEYFWVIWCIDEFQNRARSKPASFQIIL
ncbi:hypothetical protein ACFLTH_05960 [Bacteroidota bacterium]